MFTELEKYKKHGHFFYKKGENLNDKSKGVPDLPGIYYIVRLAKGKIDIVYIGKSGTMKQNGTFKDQGLRKQLNNEHEGSKRREYFDMKIDLEKIDGLDIYWFVTFDNENCHLPGYIEGQIMQIFYEVHGCLPEWNKEY